MTAAVALKWKDYRLEGRDRTKTMTLDAEEFIRRFLIHVLPTGFHRIRHYGLFASGARAHNIAVARRLLAAAAQQNQNGDVNDLNQAEPAAPSRPCPCCGGRMIVIETFERAGTPHDSSLTQIRFDTS
jgi:hypothetical protein